METLEEMRNYMREIIASIGADFTEPDDDWSQVACLDGEDGLVILGLMNELFASGFRKDILAEMLKQAMVAAKARRYAVLFNAHMASAMSMDEVEQIRQEKRRVSELPGSKEVLVLVVGDAEQEECSMAFIKRDGKTPPTLGDWEDADGFNGRFSGLNEKMREIR